VREIRTLRAMWRGLETTHGSDTEALSTETESKQSRPNLRSIGANPRPYRPISTKPAGSGVIRDSVLPRETNDLLRKLGGIMELYAEYL